MYAEEIFYKSKIVKRADSMGLLLDDKIALTIDLEFCGKLKYKELFEADDFNFAHDICGIQNNMDRENKCLSKHFVPRFSK
ncbi:MAG: DUF6874 family protein [Anaerovoracaceae bacterium]